MKTIKLFYVYFLFTLSLTVFAQSEINNIYPSKNQLKVPLDAEIIITLNESVGNFTYDIQKLFFIQGVNSGIIKGLISIENINNKIIFKPQNKLFPGEIVKVGFGPLIHRNGDTLKALHWQFTTEVPRKTEAVFDSVKRIDINTSEGGFLIDINHDGKLDIITKNGDLYYNKGNSMFHDTKLRDINGNLISNIYYISDFNHDGILDIVSLGPILSNSSYIYFGLNDTTYILHQTISSSDNPWGFVYSVGDINGDNNEDLIFAEKNSDFSITRLSVYLNDGNGSFDTHYLIATADHRFEDIALADICGDYKNDLIIHRCPDSMINQPTLLIYKNLDNRNFALTKVLNYKDTFQQPGIFIQDFNGDGFLDISIDGDCGYTYYYDKDSLSLSANFSWWIPATGFGKGVVSQGDFNGDGIYDFVFTNIIELYELGGEAPILQEIVVNTGHNFLTVDPTKIALLKDFSSNGPALVGDIDGDGAVDIINCSYPTYIAYNNVKATAVEKGKNIDTQFKVFQNYPNPFNPSTKIKYQIPNSGFVSVSLYNILGEKIKEVLNDYQTKGSHELNISLIGFSSGIYFCRISYKNETSIIKLNFIK